MKTHIHHIQYRSRGGTDDPSNLIEMNFIDHAELHAIDFINGGPMFDCRHEGWHWLDPELKKAVLSELSQRISASSWWTNGETERLSEDCPGENYVLGRLDGASIAGYLWWNDGKTQTRSKECPGDNWVKGMLTNSKGSRGMAWWTDGKTQTLANECPGDGWSLGRLPKRKKWYTDGTNNCLLDLDSDIVPEGYHEGMTVRKNDA